MYFETIFNLAKAIKSKALSPVEITEAMLARINEIDSYSSAYITVTAERALAQAKKSEAEIVAGQWRGLFGGFKDSGHGKENGRYSIHDMTELKWVTLQLGQRAFPI